MTRRVLMASLGSVLSAAPGLPDGACDTHTHVFPDPSRFPFWSGRSYTPPVATPDQLMSMHRSLGVARVVIVTPSVYGADNTATLFGIQAIGPSARGIAVISPSAAASELKRLHEQGIRGVRINLGGSQDWQLARKRLLETQAQIREVPWHIQIYCPLTVVARLAQDLRQCPVPVVLDHVGGANPALDSSQPGFQSLLGLVADGSLYVKITHRFAESAPDSAGNLIQALLKANPQRLLWGTDWPHPGPPAAQPETITPFDKTDDSVLIVSILQSLGGSAKQIFSLNPTRLYFT